MSEFSFHLFRSLWRNENKQQNLMISSLGVSTILAMCHLGASGNTRKQLAAVLDQGFSKENSWQNIMQQFDPSSGHTIMLAANSLWVKDGFILDKEFAEGINSKFKAQTNYLDFNDPHSMNEINSWVKSHTHQKIKHIIDEPLSPDAKLYLINALYFKSNWAIPFEASETTETDFLNADSTSTPIAMMKIQGQFQYCENEMLQIIELPYEGGDFSMVILLPAKSSDLEHLVTHLNLKTFSYYTGSLESKYGFLELPRFKIQYASKLKDTLCQMGIVDAFNNETADFSGMSKKEHLKIDDIFHKTFLEVNEEGSEAVAVTAGGIFRVTSIDLPQLPFRMNVDHSFLFAIRSLQNDMILFLGTFNHNP